MSVGGPSETMAGGLIHGVQAECAATERETKPMQAVRVLNNVQSNLGRLEDILSDVTRQLVGLSPEPPSETLVEQNIDSMPFTEGLVTMARKLEVQSEKLQKQLDYLRHELGV